MDAVAQEESVGQGSTPLSPQFPVLQDQLSGPRRQDTVLEAEGCILSVSPDQRRVYPRMVSYLNAHMRINK